MAEEVNRLRITRLGKSLGVLIVLVVLAAAGLFASKSHALSVGSARDCNANAVIRCGATTPAELEQKYNSQAGAKAIYGYFGITESDIDSIGSTAVAGHVTKSGQVWAHNHVVATDAMTAGRQNMSGSQRIRSGGTTFYERPTSVSFLSNDLSAFVVMNGNQFRYAILSSCGNPVIATSVAPPSSPKKKTVVHRTVIYKTVRQTPPTSVSSSSTSSANATSNVTVNQQANNQQQQQQSQSQSAPAATTTSQTQTQQQPAQTQTQTQPQALVNTGPGTGALAFAGLAAIGGTVGRLIFIRRKLTH